MKFVKFFAFIFFITAFGILSTFTHILFFYTPIWKNWILQRLVKGTNCIGVWVFQLKPFNTILIPKTQGPCLYVGNHLSYLDVIFLSSLIPMNFVTSHEMKHSLGLGQLCRLANCLFSHRHNKFKILQDIKEMETLFNQGFSIGLFPEAKSGNGDQVNPLHSALMKSAINCKIPIIPFVLNYKMIDDKPVTSHNRDSIFWYGNRAFFDHFWNFLNTKKVVIDLQFFDPIDTSALTRDQIHQLLESLFQKYFIKI